MTPATIIRGARADGVGLALSLSGTIKATGNGAAVAWWLPAIREHKAAILEALKVGAGDMTPMTADEDRGIRAWLALIDEADPATIAEVISQSQRDADARAYFIRRAAAELPKPSAFPDDRRTCTQCTSLRQGICDIAKPEAGALVVASRRYAPDPELPRRCEGYAPKASEPDQRSGAERWPGLREATT
jgi:hypothetical protein